jgi:GNAT superfamily N-acetyltransferase
MRKTGAERISVKLVENMEEMTKILAIRAAVCIGELHWQYSEYMDGNDFTSTQLLATVDGEPAGTMRIRYFGDFAKPEWLVVLERFRRGRYGGRGVAHALGSHAFAFCRMKGFTRIYGHAASDLEALWRKIAGDGVQRLADSVPTGESKGDLIPLLADYGPSAGTIGLSTLTDDEGHLLFTRPEAALGLFGRAGNQLTTNYAEVS